MVNLNTIVELTHSENVEGQGRHPFQSFRITRKTDNLTAWVRDWKPLRSMRKVTNGLTSARTANLSEIEVATVTEHTPD